MAQFIRTQFDMDFIQINQVCQISYHDERVIEIFYDTNTNCTVVDNNGQYFWLTSPDIENITIKDVLIAIGIHNEQIVLRMPENHSLINILDTDVKPNGWLPELPAYVLFLQTICFSIAPAVNR